MDQLEELRALVRTGRYVQAARDAEALIAEGSLEPSGEAKAYLIQAVAQFHMRQYWPALEAARRSEELADVSMDAVTLARARINLISLLYEVGDTGMAADVGARLLADEQSLPPEVRSELCHVHYNLSRVYRSRGRDSRMYEHLGRAITSGEETGASSDFLTMAHQLAAWWRYLDDHIAIGDRHKAAAGDLLSGDDWEGAREQLLLDCLRAHQVGDMAMAISLSEEFLLSGAQSTLLQRAWASYIAASAALYLGQVEEAATIVDRAMELAIELYSSEHINRVNGLRHRIMARKAESAGA
jgi:hypothetical protein